MAFYLFVFRYDISLVGIYSSSKKYRKSNHSVDDAISCFSQKTKKASYECHIDYSDYNVVINPGLDHFIQGDDICIYLSPYKEEIYDWKYARQTTSININL